MYNTAPMRPIQKRYINGILLVDNLYSDPKKRTGKYRYRRPDRTFKTFSADSVEHANEIAREANTRRHLESCTNNIPDRQKLSFYIPLYIKYRERINPDLISKKSWSNRKYTLGLFANDFECLSDLSIEPIRIWWDNLTHSQQKLRMAEFRRFFNWLMAEGLSPRIKYNPFTTADDLPRLLLKQKARKIRLPLTQESYDLILDKAHSKGYEALALAMGISLYTTLRESDICGLKWEDNIREGRLCVVVSKSEAQKGSARATRLAWDLKEHPILNKLIAEARELSLKNKRCPFIVSHKPKKRIWNGEKEHLYQVTSDRLSRMFRECRDLCGIDKTSFHEVRGLSSTLYSKAGYDNKDIQLVMAHESVSTTLGYQNSELLEFQEVKMKLVN